MAENYISKKVTLDENNPNATVRFKYTKTDVQIPLNVNWNEVPYISTYYIKPIVKPGEEVFIDYYITDYYHKEYMEKYNLKEDTWGDDNWTEEVWNNETFTVTVRVEGQEDKIYPNLKAGNHRVSLGSFSIEGEQKFSIVCTDKYGRNSHELFNYILVKNDVEVKEYVMTEEDLVTYNIKNNDNYEVKKIVDLSSLETKNMSTIKTELVKVAYQTVPKSKTYVCVIADTDGDGKHNNWWGETQVVYAKDYDKEAVLAEATNTRIGLQKLLDDKQAEGYNKLKLLPGIYRIDHQATIYIPDRFTLDMNGATFKLNQFTGNSALMVELNNTFDSHVINGTIEGDYFSHDYTNSPNNSEWVNGISVGGEAKYSSFDNMTVKDITGYGGGNGIANSRDKSLGYTYIYPRGIGDNFKLGDIDRTTGLDIESTTRTTCDFRDISGYENVGYLAVSIYLGYQGNPCGTWNLICHFYDENKKFIKSIDAYQYRRIGIPQGSKYMRVTILNEAYPTNLSIQYFRVPTHCAFKNIKFENCRCVGLAQAAMKDMLVENCEFTNSGQSSAKCAYDAEDGWDQMQDVTFRGLNFHDNPNNNFLTCAGHNFMIDGQTGGRIYIWERTRSLVVTNCDNVPISLQSGGSANIVRHGVYRVYDNNFAGGTVANNLSKNVTSTNPLAGLIYNSTMNGFSDASMYNNCTFIITDGFVGYLAKTSMIDCVLKPSLDFTGRYNLSFNNGHKDVYYFENCRFEGKCCLANHNGFFAGNFVNCTFEDSCIQPNVNANSDDSIIFENCEFNSSESQFIRYSPHAYTGGTFSQVEFRNCSITMNGNTASLLYAYSKPNGHCSFIDCSLNLPNGATIFDGYPTNKDLITDYNLNFINSNLTTGVKLVHDYFKDSITITINNEK